MCVFVFVCALLRVCVCARVSFFFGREPGPEVQIEPQSRWRIIIGVCVECLIGKQKKPILFKVTEPSSVPYRAPSACAKRAAYLDPPPVIPLPESIAAQAAYQLRYKNTEY